MDKGDKAVKYRPLRGYFVLAQNIAWYFATNAVCCYDMSTVIINWWEGIFGKRKADFSLGTILTNLN